MAASAPAAFAPRRAGGTRSIGRIEVFDDPAKAEEPWAALEAACPGSFYQSRGFLLPWISACAAPLGITPMLVVARNSEGAPVAMLPFGVRRRGAVHVAEYLGGKDSNANMGLFLPDVDFARDDLASMMRAAAAKAPVKPDLFLLTNQPVGWENARNVLDFISHQGSPSFLHGGPLRDDAGAPAPPKLSKDAAKKLRSKRRKLEALGPVDHVVARDGASAKRILDAFFEQKLARFKEKRIDSEFDKPETRAFLEAASATRAGAPGPVELHALMVGERIVATYAGGVHRGRMHFMVNSFDADPEIARSSPGDLLLQSILEQKSAEGLEAFDLGIGEARYKDSWCGQTVAMFDSIMPVTPLGRVAATFESLRLNVKRRLKQSETAWPLVQKLLGRR